MARPARDRVCAAALARRLSSALPLLVLTACASAPPSRAYGRVLDGWIGRSGADLVREWGVPTSAKRLPDGATLFVYDRRAWSTEAPATYPVSKGHSLLSGGGGFEAGTTPTEVGGGQPYISTSLCRTEFEVDPAGRITRGRYEGSGCEGF